MGMFDKPKTVAPAPKAALKKGKAEVQIAGVEQLAMIKALMDTLEGLAKTIEGQVKGAALDMFAAEIQKTGKRPENFTATDGGAFASVQLRRRSTQYGLSEEAIAVLRAAGVEPHKEVVTPQLFAINPAYADNQEILEKVEGALTGIGLPEDLIVMQTEVAKYVATDDTLDAVIGKKCDASVLGTVTSIACGAKLKTTDLNAILEFVADQVGVDAKFGAAAQQATERKALRVVK